MSPEQLAVHAPDAILDLRDDPADAGGLLRGECRPGCRWKVRALRLGLNRNGDRWPAALGPEIIRHLGLRPVRAVLIDGVFAHPPDHLSLDVTDPRFLGGFVERAWMEGSSIFAHVHVFHDRTRLRRGLLAMERARMLHRLAGLSPLVWVTSTPSLAADTWGDDITAVRSIVSLDLVSRPGGYEACVLRSLPLDSAGSD